MEKGNRGEGESWRRRTVEKKNRGGEESLGRRILEGNGI